ncbi:MAG: hypothetical protein NVSMB22_23210 [Chloroflexota bacterium]
MADKHTSKQAASDASDVLRDGRTSDDSKAAAASALSQAGTGSKQTSKAAAESASDVLQDKRTGKKSRSAAGSALSQAKKKK